MLQTKYCILLGAFLIDFKSPDSFQLNEIETRDSPIDIYTPGYKLFTPSTLVPTNITKRMRITLVFFMCITIKCALSLIPTNDA